MKKKYTADILYILADFKKNILEKKPPIGEMLDEVRMMRFKIRPLQGDVSLLNLKEDKLIETLWNLGKLEELYQKHNGRLTPQQKNIFFNFFDEVYHKFQNQLNKLNLRSSTQIEIPSTIEMEIFKDDTFKRN